MDEVKCIVGKLKVLVEADRGINDLRAAYNCLSNGIKEIIRQDEKNGGGN